MKKIILSTKNEIKIDDDELASVIEGIKRGHPVKVRQGIFNPSYFVTIATDEDRLSDFLSPSNERRPLPPLRDIFQGIKLEIGDIKKLLK